MSIISASRAITLEEQRLEQARGFELPEDSSWEVIATAALSRPDDAFYSFGSWFTTLSCIYGEEFTTRVKSESVA